MHIVKSIDELNEYLSSNDTLSLTLGNFDGIHKGHRDLLTQAKTYCLQQNHKWGVLSFRPHPIFMFKPETKNFLINTYEENAMILKDFGIDIYFEIEFNRDFSTQTATEFLKKYIFTCPKIKHLMFGHDFSFGTKKTGNIESVHKICQENKVVVTKGDEYLLSNKKISSSIIRDLIRNGSVDEASELLGRDHFIRGLVVKGEGRGRKIGFPTANLNYSAERVIPCNGVYVTKVHSKDMIYQSVTNVGRNPTFNDEDVINIESHILDFDEDIYGENITVEFVKKLREEKKFPSVNDLMAQIQKDVDSARIYYDKH